MVKDAHYKRLMFLPQATKEISQLRSMVDEIEKHLRILDAMGENINQAYLLTLIKTKIPSEIMEQLELSKGFDEFTVELLRSRLMLHLYAKEESIRNTSPLIQLGAQPDTSIRPKSLDSFNTPPSNMIKGNRFTSETFSNSSYPYNSRPALSSAY